MWRLGSLFFRSVIVLANKNASDLAGFFFFNSFSCLFLDFVVAMYFL